MSRTLSIPRGKPGLEPIQFNMVRVDTAESRLSEVRVLNAGVASDLKAVFSEALADLGRYIATTRFEYLQTKQQLELARAEALLDKYPAYVQTTLKESGMKDNADIREAFINRDPEFAHWQSVMNHLDAMTALLEAKTKTLERAYWDCRANLEDMMKINNTRTFNEGLIPPMSQPQQESQSQPGMAVGKSRF